jgi:hypothetical protein
MKWIEIMPGMWGCITQDKQQYGIVRESAHDYSISFKSENPGSTAYLDNEPSLDAAKAACEAHQRQ